MKGELEELGEEVDDNVDSISKVQTQILNLTKGKVNIFNDKNEFRDYYEIMQDIADVFGELKSTDQANLSEILFGKQRGNTGAALISAFQSGQIGNALTTANNSEGSAEREQSRWLESIEAKQQQFKASFQELSQEVINSDFAKSLIDNASKFLNILTKIVDKFGVASTLIVGIAAVAPFKNFGKE